MTNEIHFQHWMDSIVIVFLGFYLERVIEWALMQTQRIQQHSHTHIQQKENGQRKSANGSIEFNAIPNDAIVSHIFLYHIVSVSLYLMWPTADLHRFNCVSIFLRHKLLPLLDAKWNVQLQHHFKSSLESILCFMLGHIPIMWESRHRDGDSVRESEAEKDWKRVRNEMTVCGIYIIYIFPQSCNDCIV